MNPLTGKVLLVSIPTAGVVGTGAYFGLVRPSISKETIKSKLEQEIEWKARKILSSPSDVIWEKYKVLYKKDLDASRGITGVKESDLPSWCEVTLSKEYFDKEDSNYQNVHKWCVVNINTLQKELETEKQLNFIPFDGGDGSKWKKAWKKYNSDKQGLEITDSSLSSTTVNSEETGGPALKEWCKSKLEKNMYEDLGEDKAIEKVERYCVIGRSTD